MDCLLLEYEYNHTYNIIIPVYIRALYCANLLCMAMWHDTLGRREMMMDIHTPGLVISGPSRMRYSIYICVFAMT